MADPYEILGVAPKASEEELKRAYRALAKRFHPDGNEGNPDAVRRFQEVTGAYEFLKDAHRRSRFDRGEIDAEGNRIRRGRGARKGPAAAPRKDRAQEVFSELFGLKSDRSARTPAPERGQDTRYRLSVGFLEAARGTTRRVRLPTGARLDVRIPPGVEDGQQLRLKGQGSQGASGGDRGDALVTVDVEPHPQFRREGRNVYLDLPITVHEAVQGGRIAIPGLSEALTVSLPEGLRGGEVFRLKGKGIPPAPGESGEPGDQIVTVRVTLPGPDDPQFEKLVRKWRPKSGYRVRDDLESDGKT